MNSTFDFGRFSALIRRQWINFGKIYLMSLGIVAGIFVFFYAYYLWDAISSGTPNVVLDIVSFRPYVFITIGLIFIAVVSSTYFANLGDKSKAIFELLIPASSLEKFMVSVFYTFIMPVLSYFLLFFVIDFIFVSYERHVFADFIQNELKQSSEYNQRNFLKYFFTLEFPIQLYLLTFIPVLLSSIFLLGSIYFTKFHFIKTAISLIIYVFVFVFLMVKIMSYMTDGTILIKSDSGMHDEMNVLRIICVVGIILSIVFWVIGYLRLKEKEV